MSTPGSNLLKQASKLIKFTVIVYFKFGARSQNAVKQWVTTFEPGFNLRSSVQRVPRTKYKDYGLDFQKNYVKVFASANMVDIERDSSGDQFIYKGRVYNLGTQGSWYHEDGWAVCIGVDIGSVETASPKVS